jgi:two-component system cell cycle response regulator
MEKARGKRILVVDDDPENLKLMNELVSAEGHSVTTAPEGETALHKVRAWKPHVILLDVNMPGMSGLDLIPKIRSSSPDYISIVMVSANAEPTAVAEAINRGADDYLIKPYRAQELMPRLRLAFKVKELNDSLKRLSQKLEEQAASDELTGLLNFRSLFKCGEEEIEKSKKFGKPFSMLLVDIDGFSSINEARGFKTGNEVIAAVAEKIRGCVRSVDLVARVSGDEFAALFPDTDLGSAEFLAERIRESIEKTVLQTGKTGLSITASLGVAGIKPDGLQLGSMSDLFRCAAEALRSAKTAKNRVEVYSFV